jgi:hypothetical protein
MARPHPSAPGRGSPTPSGSGSGSRTVLVMVLVLVLATCVALVLAQSAGVIDLPLLGGANGQSAPAVPATAPSAATLTATSDRLGTPPGSWDGYSPAKRSSSPVSIGPTRLRAST